jgi:hypothetical protein
VVSAERLQFGFRSAPSGGLAVRSVPSTGPIAGILAEERRQDDRQKRQRRPPTKIAQRPVDPHREPSAELLAAWAPIEAELRLAVDELSFNIWLARLHPHRRTSGIWVLACPERGISWIRDRFGRVIAACAGQPVEYVVCERPA